MYDSRFFYENLKVPTVAMGKRMAGRQSAGALHGGGITAWLRVAGNWGHLERGPCAHLQTPPSLWAAS